MGMGGDDGVGIEIGVYEKDSFSFLKKTKNKK